MTVGELYFERHYVSLGTASLEFAVTKTEKVRKVCEITSMLLKQSGDLFPEFRGKSAKGVVRNIVLRGIFSCKLCRLLRSILRTLMLTINPESVFAIA